MHTSQQLLSRILELATELRGTQCLLESRLEQRSVAVVAHAEAKRAYEQIEALFFLDMALNPDSMFKLATSEDRRRVVKDGLLAREQTTEGTALFAHYNAMIGAEINQQYIDGLCKQLSTRIDAIKCELRTYCDVLSLSHSAHEDDLVVPLDSIPFGNVYENAPSGRTDATADATREQS